MRLLLFLLPILLPLAAARGEVPGSRGEAHEREHGISAALVPLDDHARGARHVRTRAPSLISLAGTASRLLTFALPVRHGWVRAEPAPPRGSRLERGCRAATRGTYLPYFPTPPPASA